LRRSKLYLIKKKT